MSSLTLWRFSPITGYWKAERAVSADTAQSWLEIFKADEPSAVFKISKSRPNEVPHV